LEEARRKAAVRNDMLLKKVQETLEGNAMTEGLNRAREQLEESKRAFLRELNQRDPMWREKMRTRKIE
jgi:hypothetical protein